MPKAKIAKPRPADKADPRKGGKQGKKRRDWKTPFLKAFRESANVRAACEKAKVSRQVVYLARQSDTEFAADWDDAEKDACDLLELETRRRAYDGVEEPVFGSMGATLGSGEVGKRTVYSNTLMMFLLKAHNPQKFGERTRNENVNLDLNSLNDKQLELLANGANLSTVIAAASASGTGTEAQTSHNTDD